MQGVNDMWVVKRCVKDFEDVFKTVVAEFETDTEADAWAEQEQDSSNPFPDVWFEVEFKFET
jgi:hypothetical protein